MKCRVLPKINIGLLWPGTPVKYGGWPQTVEYVLISANGMMVKLAGMEDLVKSDHLEIPDVTIDLNRRPDYD